VVVAAFEVPGSKITADESERGTGEGVTSG
jgi:hypothetical protein